MLSQRSPTYTLRGHGDRSLLSCRCEENLITLLLCANAYPLPFQLQRCACVGLCGNKTHD